MRTLDVICKQSISPCGVLVTSTDCKASLIAGENFVFLLTEFLSLWFWRLEHELHLLFVSKKSNRMVYTVVVRLMHLWQHVDNLCANMPWQWGRWAQNRYHGLWLFSESCSSKKAAGDTDRLASTREAMNVIPFRGHIVDLLLHLKNHSL